MTTERFHAPPAHVRTGADAIELLGYLSRQWECSVLDTPDDPQSRQPNIDQGDIALADFIAQHPGALEAMLEDTDAEKQLAGTIRHDGHALPPGKAPDFLTSVLGHLLNSASAKQGHFLWRTVRALPSPWLFLFVRRCVRQYQNAIGGQYFFGAKPAQTVAQWLGPQRMGDLLILLEGRAPREYIDWLILNGKRGLPAEAHRPASPERFPSILPEADEDVLGMGSDAIARTLADYRGMSVENFNRLLIKRRFLAEGEHVGEIIHRDIKVLVERQVSRHEVARILTEAGEYGDKLQWACLEAMQQRHENTETLEVEYPAFRVGDREIHVEYGTTLGHHLDPLHSFDTYYDSAEVGGDSEGLMSYGSSRVRFSNMHPYLIRRAGFFEGNVDYRLDVRARVCQKFCV